MNEMLGGTYAQVKEKKDKKIVNAARPPARLT
jgi:hypothetical protein